MPVLEDHDVHPPGLLDPHDRADPAGLDLLDHEAGLCGHLARGPRGARMGTGEDVVGIAVCHVDEPAKPRDSHAAGHAA